MEQLNDNKLICHIVGLNPRDKQKLVSLCNKYNKYNIIDLDPINNDILNNEEMSKMFKTYSRLKKNKNDKYKELDKKMTKYWEDNMIINVYNNIVSKKENIIIGKNHHYRLVSKKINFQVSNKFILESNLKEEVRNKIKYNLKVNHNKIVNGTFPLQFLDYNNLLKKRKNFEESYIKNGYVKVKIDELISIFKNNNKRKIKGLWISLKEPFNIGSKIYPHKGPLYAYIDPVLSLINSFNMEDINYQFDNDKVMSFDNLDLNKLSKPRYLYYVSKEHFILFDTKNKHKFISNNPVEILEKEKIKNVYKKLSKLNLIEK